MAFWAVVEQRLAYGNVIGVGNRVRWDGWNDVVVELMAEYRGVKIVVSEMSRLGGEMKWCCELSSVNRKFESYVGLF
jgi:hypothetical protein